MVLRYVKVIGNIYFWHEGRHQCANCLILINYTRLSRLLFSFSSNNSLCSKLKGSEVAISEITR